MRARGFWNDKDGMTADDLEKIVLLILSVVSVAICFIMYCIRGDITPNAVYLTIGILTLMVTRKGLSYFSGGKYYGNNTNADIVKANNPEQYNPYMTNGYGSYGTYDNTGMYGSTYGYGNGYDQYNQGININPNLNMNIGSNNDANNTEQNSNLTDEGSAQ